VNTSALAPEAMIGWEPGVLWRRVLRIQRKLHRWAGDDPLAGSMMFNLVCDPAALVRPERVELRGALPGGWMARVLTTSRPCAVSSPFSVSLRRI
jgi:hypothetical protein